MTVEQMRQRLGEIAAALNGFAGKALSEDEMTNVNALHEEFEGLQKQIETQEKIDQMSARAAQTTRQSAPAAVRQPEVTVGVDRITLDPKRGFKGEGEFYSAVIAQVRKGVNDARIVKAGLMEKGSEDGGILVPEDFRTDIQEKVQGDESLLPRTTQFQTASNNLTLPVYETAPWDSTQGVQAYWTGEGQQILDSKTKMGEFSMRLHKLAALVKVTDELMEDAPLLESWIKVQAPKAIVAKINSALIAGTGAGMPQGLLGSSFRITVAKESGQAADTVLFKNINKMLAALAPASIARAVWLANPNVLPQLRTMEFSPGSSTPVPVYMPSTGVSGAPFGTLFGLPILPMMGGLKALGDEGDLILVDMAYYYSAVKTAGVKASMSTHVYFEQDINALKFTQRIAGGIPYKAPIVNEAGDYSASGIVTLADRA